MIAILGGGITGLAAAYELASRRVPFALAEAADRLGGLIRTERIEGFVVEAGPDSVLAQKPAAVRLCEELGLPVVGSTPPRTAFVLRGRRLHALPSPSVLGIPASWPALARYDLLGWPARARLALEPLVPRGRGGDESVASFFRRRFGAATVGLVAEPLLGGIHGGDVERLSMLSLFPRLVEAERGPARVLRGLGRGARPNADGLFRSLSGGMEALVTAIAGRLPDGSVRLRAPASRLRRAGNGWQVTAGDGTIEAAAVILAVPAPAAGALLEDVDAPAAAICRAVPYASTASVALGWRRGDVRHPLAGSGFVVARRHSGVRITACTWVSSKWPGRAPEGHVLLRAFLGGTHDPGAVDASDAELVAQAVGDLSGVLGIDAPPVLARVHRYRGAGAQHNVGHRARMAALSARLRDLPGLRVAGSGYDAVGIPDCVAGGRAAAAAADCGTLGAENH